MMKLEDYRPSAIEEILTENMPEQVAIGYIRAKRRTDMRRYQESGRAPL